LQPINQYYALNMRTCQVFEQIDNL
jgi:hypothetical protein